MACRAERQDFVETDLGKTTNNSAVLKVHSVTFLVEQGDEETWSSLT